MKLHNVSHNRSLSQSMSAVSCIPSIFMTIDMSSSSRIEKLLSNYSSESAEWKVLHEKKKNGRCPFLHLVNFTEFCSSYISCYSVSRTYQISFVKIGFRVLVFLTARDRILFCPDFVSVIYLL